MAVKRNHVIAVGGNIVSGGTERGQDKAGDQPAVGRTGTECQSKRGKTESDRQLRGQHPCAFRAVRIQKRRPQEFQAPRQPDDPRPERHCTVGHAEAREHHHGNAGGNGKRKPFRKINAGNPAPAVDGQFSPQVHRMRIRDSNLPEPLRYCRAAHAAHVSSAVPFRARNAGTQTTVRAHAGRCQAFY